MMRYDGYDGKRHESIVTDAPLLYRCDYDGKRYEFTVRAEQSEGCPKWDTEANPPLSAAMALDKAKEFIATIKTKEGFWWELEELGLVKIDGWMWQVRYRLARHGPSTGAPPTMPCWILMDGTVIQPRVTEM